LDNSPSKEDTIGDLNMLLGVVRLLWPETCFELLCFINKDHPILFEHRNTLVKVVHVEVSETWQEIAAQAAKYLKENYKTK
jgi:hypothetical protein